MGGEIAGDRNENVSALVGIAPFRTAKFSVPRNRYNVAIGILQANKIAVHFISKVYTFGPTFRAEILTLVATWPSFG